MAAPPPSDNERGAFGSRLGFILAAAGSAIGLGNIWRFPYTAGENGGGAFVLVYLACVVAIGVPVILAELSMGRASGSNPVGAFKKLAGDGPWKLVGALGVVTGFGILAFYSVVAGWTLAYLGKAVTGEFGDPLTADESGAIFNTLIGDATLAVALAGVFMLLTVVVVRGGVSGGIERASKILMPIFFVLLVALAFRSVTLPGGIKGVDFMFEADFSKINGTVFMAALGQALFSLSLGMGAMITYGSYFPRNENLPFAGISVAFCDTLIALLGGFMIFPALFAAGVEPSAGPGLVFVVLPTIFHSLPMGGAFAAAFYGLLAIAALTSTISLLEVVVSYFVDERGWTREKAAWTVGTGCFLVAVPSALSQGASEALTSMWGGQGWLGGQSILFGNYALSLGALFICLFVAWKWGVKNALDSLEEGGHELPLSAIWALLIRFVCPIAVAGVLGYIIYTGQYF